MCFAVELSFCIFAFCTCDLRAFIKIVTEGLITQAIPALQSPLILLMYQSTLVGRNVEQEHSISSNRTVINFKQFLRRLDLFIFFGMIEPPGANRNIRLGRIPHETLCFGYLPATAK